MWKGAPGTQDAVGTGQPPCLTYRATSSRLAFLRCPSKVRSPVRAPQPNFAYGSPVIGSEGAYFDWTSLTISVPL